MAAASCRRGASSALGIPTDQEQLMARSADESPESVSAPGAAAPATVAELIGRRQDEGRPDPEAARAALDAGAPEMLTDEPAPPAPASGRDRRRGGVRRGRRPNGGGGIKPTKAELERELRELRQQAEAAAPATVALIQSQAQQLAPALGATFATAFGMLARRRGAHWKLADDERQMLADHWSICLAPYMAQAGPYIPWAAAVMVTWGVVEGRVERDAAQVRTLAPAA